MVWTRAAGSPDQFLIANARTWKLPWVAGEVYMFEEEPEVSDLGTVSHPWCAREALGSEGGEVVITKPFPYLFRCIWGDATNVLNDGWAGDRILTQRYYWRYVRAERKDDGAKGTQSLSPDGNWVFAQRDFAQRHHDGSYTFHGRSDEVMNVSGMLFGTETIENAILRDRYLHDSSPLGNCIVVGHPHALCGEMPLAFVAPKQDEPHLRISEAVLTRLTALVTEAIGNIFVDFVQVAELPRSKSGKVNRRLIRALVRDERTDFLEAATSLENPDCLVKLRDRLSDWREAHQHLMRPLEEIPRGLSGVSLCSGASGFTGNEDMEPRSPSDQDIPSGMKRVQSWAFVSGTDNGYPGKR